MPSEVFDIETSQMQPLPQQESTFDISVMDNAPIGQLEALQELQQFDLSGPLDGSFEWWNDSEDLLGLLTANDPSYLDMPADDYPTPLYSSHNIIADGPPSRGTVTPIHGGQQAMQQVKQSLRDLSQKLSKEVESRYISSEFVESSLNMFLMRSIPAMPIIHGPTFASRDCDHTLLLNMISLGAIFIAGDETTNKADALWRLANAAVATSWEGLLRRKGPNDDCPGIQLVVTSYLRSMYAMLSVSTELRAIGQTSLGLGFTWAQQAGIVTAASRARTELCQTVDIPPLPVDKSWKTWVADETQRRAVLGHYVLDGLLTDFTGQPTAIRHTANPVLLPSQDSLFEAKTADQWITQLHREKDACDMSFRELYVELFDSTSDFERMQLSYLSIRVVLEALQSLIYEHHEAGGCTIGTPSKQDIGRALVRLYKTQIRSLPTTQLMVEHAIRWHVICIRLNVETTALAKQLCSVYNIAQDLHSPGHCSTAALPFPEWAKTSGALRALLHAVALADLALQVNLGRAHCVHLPMAIYTAAVIYAAVLAGKCQLGERPVIALPKVDNWEVVCVASALGGENANVKDIGPVQSFVVSGVTSTKQDGVSRRYLADDLNGLHLVMEQLRPYWGITGQMSNIIDQWLSIARTPLGSAL